MWKFQGKNRPSFALEAAPGQESVWDYPRPPACKLDGRRVVVRIGSQLLADSYRAVRVLETASPPTFYIPPGDVDQGALVPAKGSSFCEWKGAASYWRVATSDEMAEPQAWCYRQPTPSFRKIAGFYSFYPGRVECYVDEERVKPQAGGFYGGWVTSEIVGPFKGDAGTGHW